jgi:2-iminobutanoate/2-iminopropanoate deaminase
MTNRRVSPSSIAPTAAGYTHAVLSEAPQRWLHTSGAVPTRPDGSVADDLAEQAATVWANLRAILAEAGMGVADIVAMTTYVVAGNDLLTVMAERDRAMEGHLAASTLVVVPSLARPAYRVEIAVVAAT